MPYNMNQNSKSMKQNKISNIGIFLFVAYIYLYSLIDTTIKLSNNFFYFYLFITIVGFTVLGSILKFNRLYLYEILFFLSIGVLLFNIIKGHEKAVGYLFYFLLGLTFSIFAKYNVAGMKIGFRAILFFSVIYAVTIVLSFLNPSYFQDNLHVYYTLEMQVLMKQYLSQGLYSGIVPFVATASGYMVNGIALLIYNNNGSIFKMKKRTRVVLLITLIIALVLTGKRAMFLFSLMSFILVYLIDSNGWKRIKRFYQVLFIVLFLAIFILIVGSSFTGNNAISRTIQTIYSLIINDESIDITNGRSVLVKYAITLFLNNPLFGIGWWEYVNASASFIGRTITPHNIYVQLLCETGIIGFFSFIVPITVCLNGSMKSLKLIKQKYGNGHYLSSIKTSIFYQIFFLLYGITGNPLYDYEFLLLYFFAIGVYGAIRYSMSNEMVKN